MTVLPCSDWRDIMAMRAIGQATLEESRALDGHLGTCEQCRLDAAEVAGAAAALSVLSPTQVDRLERDQPMLAEPALYAAAPPAASWRWSFRPASTGPVGGPDGPVGPRQNRRWLAGVGVAAVGIAAAAVAVLTLSGGSPAPERTVALGGERGVVASVVLTAQASGTHATLRESGQPAGQVLTVSMKSWSGRGGGWPVATGPPREWVRPWSNCRVPWRRAGSPRSGSATSRAGPCSPATRVELRCRSRSGSHPWPGQPGRQRRRSEIDTACRRG